MASSACSNSPALEALDPEHWLSASDLLEQLDIVPGMTVAEIGAGAGSYTLPIGGVVGPTGSVFAIEWRSWLIPELDGRIAGSIAPIRIQSVAGRAAETGLPSASCDVVILADVWHELMHHDAVLAEARRILKANGRLAIINWRPDTLCPPGPPVEHRVSMKKTVCTVEQNSWSLVKAAEIGTFGYLLVFEVTDESVQS